MTERSKEVLRVGMEGTSPKQRSWGARQEWLVGSVLRVRTPAQWERE